QGEDLAVERDRLEALALELQERERSLGAAGPPEASGSVARGDERDDREAALDHRRAELGQLEQSLRGQREALHEEARKLAARAAALEGVERAHEDAVASVERDLEAAAAERSRIAEREEELTALAASYAGREQRVSEQERELTARERLLDARAAE